MGLTSSLFAGLSGMKSNEFRMDVIGNNIANVNTHGFKSQRATFQSQFSQTFSFGTAPSGTIGGTNPLQVGTGSSVGSMSRDFSMGAPEATGIKTDMAIQGQGMFILSNSNGGQFYTRAGNFQLNSENDLISSQGYYLQGYEVDKNFNLNVGSLSRIKIPIGEISTATMTTSAAFSGNLEANSKVDPSDQLAANGQPTRPILTTTAAGQFHVGGVLVTDGTPALTTLEDSLGNQLFYDDNVITLSLAQKGGGTLEPAEFIVGTTGTTLDEFSLWLEGVLGIQTTSVPDYTLDGVSNPGVTITATGEIQIVGNIGHENQIVMGSNALTVTQGTGLTPPFSSTPFQFDSNVSSSTDPDDLKEMLGDSFRTGLRAYDSIGNSLDIDIVLVKKNIDATGGTTWQLFAESPDSLHSTSFSRSLGTGTVSFDANGKYLSSTDMTITIYRDGTGALTTQTIELDLSAIGSLKQPSSINKQTQNGFPAGTLTDYSIGVDGIITGAFKNGLNRILGQVVLATFRNYEGLVESGGNLYTSGPNSGDAIEKAPLALGAGSIQSASLELSNVDLSREFINLIISSTGFSASSRVIQTSDQLLNELIALVR